METKNIVLSIAGAEGEEHREVAIGPGTRPLDVLAQLGLTGFQMMKPDGGAFAMTEDLYPARQRHEGVRCP